MRGVFDQYIAAAHFFTRRQFHLRLIRRQAVQLIDHLLNFAQVKQFTRFTWKAHPELAVGDAAALRALQLFQPAFDYLDLEHATGEVLLEQVGTAGNQPFGQVAVSDDLEHLIELRHAQALANVGLDQRLAFAFRERVGTGNFESLDGKAAGVDGRCWLGRRGCFARQVLEFFETTLLLFEQTVLTVTNQIGDARRVLRGGGLSQSGCAQAKKSGQQAEPGPA